MVHLFSIWWIKIQC